LKSYHSSRARFLAGMAMLEGAESGLIGFDSSTECFGRRKMLYSNLFTGSKDHVTK